MALNMNQGSARSDIAKTSGSVSVATSSTVVAADNPGRASITITNDHASQVVYLAFATTPGTNPTAVANSGARLPAGSTFTTQAYTGPIAGISLARIVHEAVAAPIVGAA
jgi:hypothetical protein